MARVTVEDAVAQIGNRFDLVLIAGTSSTSNFYTGLQATC